MSNFPPPPSWRQATAEPVYPPIGGWLILVLIGLVFTGIVGAYAALTSIGTLATPGLWARLTTPGSPAYHPVWSALIVYEVAGRMIIFGFTCVLLWLMLTRRRAFRPWMIIYLLAVFAFPFGDRALGNLIPAVSVHQPALSPEKLAQMTLSTLIWVPYMLLSNRVQYTFVR